MTNGNGSAARGGGGTTSCRIFVSSKSDLDFDGDLHGQDGPTPIRRVKREDWTALAREAHEYALTRQLPLVADMNADFRDGYCALPMSNTPPRRGSAAIC